MPDFMDEVRAEVRNQRVLDLFEKYRYHLLAAAVALVVGTGISTWYNAHTLNQQEEAGIHYLDANAYIVQDDAESALPRLNAVIEKGTPGWQRIAMLQRAAQLIKQKKYDEATDTYNEIIADSSADVLFRDYAVVMSAWVMLEHGGDQSVAEQRLEAMRGEGKPWRFTATELLGLAAMKRGDTAKARTLFTELKNGTLTPTHMQARAEEMLASLPPEEAKKEEPTKESKPKE